MQCEKYPEFCRTCWRRWKTKRGLENHRCDKVHGKMENLQNLLTPVKSNASDDDVESELDLSFFDFQLAAELGKFIYFLFLIFLQCAEYLSLAWI